LHEGDWEMIQVRLRGEDPDLAVYCQHAHSTSRDWRQVDRLPGTERPIVYVARGSHASYFEPGTHWTGVWFDHADGKRRSPELALETVAERDPAWRWIHWPGHWGGTKKTGNPLDSDSPPGPASHKQWTHPSTLLEEPQGIAGQLVVHPSAPPAPAIEVTWSDDGRIRVHYEATADAIGLVVTVNSPDERQPPTTETFPLEAPSGDLIVAAQVDPAHTYDVYTSVATKDGLASESVRADLSPISPRGE
jgi:hypothetical protein